MFTYRHRPDTGTRRRRLVTMAVFLPLCVSALAGESPYAGQEHGAIKALSPDAIEGYLEGRGMGYAMAAELNQYPGPKHVLELAPELGLSQEQIERTRELFVAMQAEASRLGKQRVALEGELDRQFATATITDETLVELTTSIATLEGQIRATHLGAHLAQKALLTEHQVRQYDQLRGYSAHHTHPEHRMD